ncbi:Sir2 histone deacetylase Hst2 [Gnomoniopsis sp. IMI 355080]|nr:Sir2 histone deacetylase Hst2 [Gnomoniopsis sp. IMI 355080]
MGNDQSVLDDSVPPVKLEERSLSAVAKLIKDGKATKIVVMTGAGLSTAAGIPDFRSPGTGLYANLARLNLPTAESVFDIGYFRENPNPFYVLAKELYPGNYKPTLSHAFIALLAKKGLLRLLFTQNIDCLEREAGVPGELIIEAHGSFATQRCIECRKEFPDDIMKKHVLSGEVPRCVDKETCNGLVKPDIVFFGEALPSAFFHSVPVMEEADLALVMGTSLTVHPFAALPDRVEEDCPRVLFNMERVGSLGTRPDDVLALGDCDANVCTLADELGWLDELHKLWEDTVGTAETERQLKGIRDRKKKMLSEMDELTKRIGAGLSLDDADENDESEGAANVGATDNPGRSEDVAEDREGAKSEPEVDAEKKSPKIAHEKPERTEMKPDAAKTEAGATTSSSTGSAAGAGNREVQAKEEPAAESGTTEAVASKDLNKSVL